VIHVLSAVVVSCLRRTLGAFVVLGALLVSVAAVSVPAAVAAVRCWKTLLNDWYDGRIDHVYPIPCYEEATRRLPPAMTVYSSAGDDIRRALQLAIAYKKNPKTAPPPTITMRGSVASSGSSNGGGSGGCRARGTPARCRA
jgi:hypothetical protein